MSSLIIAGDVSGTVALQAPSAAGTTILTLPATSGTLVTTTGGTATTATNLAGGSAGTVPYQTSSGTTSMLAAGTTGQSLLSGGAGAPTWGTPASATTATNVAGGVAGNVPYQTGSGATSFVTNGTSGQYLQSTGTGAPVWAGVGNLAISSNTSASVGVTYYCDTSAGAFTLTLPTTPTNGSTITVFDSAGAWNKNALTISAAQTINGVSGPLTCNMQGQFFVLQYVSSSTNWRLQ